MRRKIHLGLQLTSFLFGIFAASQVSATCPISGSEHDGDNQRACETVVIGSDAGNGDTAVFNAWNLAQVPTGGLVPGDGYIYVKVHTLHSADFWHPSSSFGHLTYCKDSANAPRGEMALLFRQKLQSSELKKPWEFVGRLSACEDVVGDASTPNAWTIGGTIGRGLAPNYGLKYYVFGNRTKCTTWTSGCMDSEYLGAATTPTGLAIANPIGSTANDDKSPAVWRLSPFLKLSDPGGAGHPLSFNSVVSVKSFDYDPAPPAWISRVTDPALGASATLWGFVQWDYLSQKSPGRVAAFQIVDASTTLRPSWSQMSVWIYTNIPGQNPWQKVDSNGNLPFVPYDVKPYFPKVSMSGLIYYNGKWNVSGHSGQWMETTGCNEASAPFTNTFLGNYATSYSTVAMQELYPSSQTRFYNWDTLTQNSANVGALIFPLGQELYVLRASTEVMCFDHASEWIHPWNGQHLTLESLGTPVIQ